MDNELIVPMSNGTRVIKVNSEEGDLTPNGTLGNIEKGFVIPSEIMEKAQDEDSLSEMGKKTRVLYVVKWDNHETPVVCIDQKVKQHE